MSDNLTKLRKNKSISDIKSNNQIKTTNINILLNRVRSEKKKTLKKKIFVSLFLAFLVCSLTVYLII